MRIAVRGVPGRRVARTLLLLGPLVILGPPAAAQEGAAPNRVVAVVDYIAGPSVYLSAGSDQGLVPGDTVLAYRDGGQQATLLGALRVVSATRRRAVVTFVGDPFSLERSEVLYLGVPRRAEVDPGPADPTADSVAADAAPTRGPTEPAPPAQSEAGVTRAPGVTGRFSVDFDARETTTRWGDEELTRSFATPTVRLTARITELPGGMRLSTNLRGSYRRSSGTPIEPTGSMRVYQLSLEKSFERVPVDLRLGRFYNPYEDFSGYWDGFLAHYGEGVFGGGVAVGFEPDRWNEGLSTEAPKVSAFLDVRKDWDQVGYDANLSFHSISPKVAPSSQRFVGLSHRIFIGGASLRQRIQMDRDPAGGSWIVSRHRLDLSAPLFSGVYVHGGYQRTRPAQLWRSSGVYSDRRERFSAGLSYFGVAGSLTIDASETRRENLDPSRAISSSLSLLRTPLFGLDLRTSVGYSTHPGASSLYLQPGVSRSFGRIRAQGLYRLYRTERDEWSYTTHGADLSFSFPLAHGVHSRIQAVSQWSGTLTSYRILASLWKSF